MFCLIAAFRLPGQSATCNSGATVLHLHRAGEDLGLPAREDGSPTLRRLHNAVASGWLRDCRNEKNGYFGSQLRRHVFEPSGQGVLEMLELTYQDGEIAPPARGGQSLESDAHPLEGLTPLLYEQLRRLARRHMIGQRRGHTLSTTDLINEAYLKLAHLDEPKWKHRIHFLAVASSAMRSVLVDYARKRCYAKRGANPIRVSLTGANLTSEQPGEEVLAIDQALRRLSELDPRKSQVVELRYFGGLGIEEVAQVLAISTGTVKREWEKARAWLRGELGRVQGG